MPKAQANALYLEKCLMRKSLFNQALYDLKNMYPEQLEKSIFCNYDLMQRYGRFNSKRFVKYLFSWFSWILSGYGKRPLRFLFWLLGIIMIVALFLEAL